MPLTHGRCATLFSCYAQTLSSPEDNKDAFYEQLDAELQRIPETDKLIVLSDFNARVGSDHRAWARVVGRHGVGKINANGHRLLSICSQNQLIITNPIFQTKNQYKGTWEQPRSKQWHMLHYVIVKKGDRQYVLLTRAMRGAECWTDQRLVRSSLSLNIRPLTRRRPAKKKMDCASLRSDIVKESLRTAIAHRLADAPHVEEFEDCVEGSLSNLAHTVIDAAKEFLCFVKRKKQGLV